jgi:hypothetical protein
VLWVDRAKLGPVAFDVDALTRWFADTVRGFNGVARVNVVDDLGRADTTTDAIARRWIRMFRPGTESYPGLKALVAVTLQPFYTVGGSQPGSHGTPHDADAHVPLAFLGSAIRSGRFGQKANTVDIAPTLAALLGVTPLERLDGRVLREALR